MTLFKEAALKCKEEIAKVFLQYFSEEFTTDLLIDIEDEALLKMYDAGFEAGRAEGYEEGYDEGYFKRGEDDK